MVESQHLGDRFKSVPQMQWSRWFVEEMEKKMEGRVE